MQSEVFVVHTRRHPAQQRLYDYFFAQATHCGFALFDYGDWEWERPGERVLDVREAAHRNPDPYEVLPARINDETLLRMWSACRVLAIVNPPGLHQLKAGAQHELEKLPAFYAERRNAPTPIPIAFNLGHARDRVFRGIPIAYTLSTVDADDSLSAENAFALLALTWLIHGVERAHGLDGSRRFGDELLDELLSNRMQWLHRGEEPSQSESQSAEPNARLEKFWNTNARSVRVWFSKARDVCRCVQSGRTFIAAIESQS